MSDSLNEIAKGIRANLIELFKRVSKFVKSDKYYTNGEDNKYPIRLERVVYNSPTGSRACSMLIKYIFGQGLDKNFITDEEEVETLNDIVYKICSDLALHNGFYLKVPYKFDTESGIITKDYSRMKVMDFSNCRIGMKDDNDNPSQIVVSDFSDGEEKPIGNSKVKLKYYPPFNPNEEVVRKQMIKQWEEKKKGNKYDGSVEQFAEIVGSFSGQILYVNTTPQFIYPMSRFDCVYNDCDTEFRISLHTNSISRSGFLGKTAILTNGLDPDTADKVVEDIRSWLGAENSASLYHLDLDGHEDIENAFHVKELKSNFDDKMYIETDKRIRRNILGAANNIPEALLFSSEGALFDGSGEKYEQMKIFYNEQTKSERKIINQTLELIGLKSVLVPLVPDDTKIKQNVDA